MMKFSVKDVKELRQLFKALPKGSYRYIADENAIKIGEQTLRAAPDSDSQSLFTEIAPLLANIVAFVPEILDRAEELADDGDVPMESDNVAVVMHGLRRLDNLAAAAPASPELSQLRDAITGLRDRAKQARRRRRGPKKGA